jgi:hypothetical protein
VGLHWGVCRPISGSSGSSSSGSGVTRARDDSSPVARCYQLPLPLPLPCPQKQRTAALATTRETECHAAHRLSWPKQLDTILSYALRNVFLSSSSSLPHLCWRLRNVLTHYTADLSLSHTLSHTLTHSLSCNGILLCYVQQSNY